MSSKPHSELVARVRSALGASGEQEVRGRAALDELVEQLEAAQREVAEWRDDAELKQSELVRELQEQLEAAQKALRDFAEHGVRHDLNPTRKVPTPDGFWLAYIDRIDRAVRERALAALFNPASEPEGT